MISSKKLKKSELRFAVLATDVVCFRIIDGKLNVLLGEVKIPEFKDKLGLIGGLVLPQETAEQSVDRHLRDKAGIVGIYKEQLYTFSKIDRDPRGRVVSVAYLALTDKGKIEKKPAVQTSWVPVEDLSTLAYDHNDMVNVALNRLRSKIGYTNIVRYLLPMNFTLTELQRVYEIILKKNLDKRNFRKKILKLKMVKATGRQERGAANRPAELYKFADKDVRMYELF